MKKILILSILTCFSYFFSASQSKVGNWKFYENGKVVKEVKAEKFSKELAKYEEKRMKALANTQKEGKK